MQLAEITTEVVESFLRGTRSGELQKNNLLDMLLVRNIANPTREGRELAMQDLLNGLIESAYHSLRQAENLPNELPTNRQNLTAQIKSDFSLGNSELEAWSAIFFRYQANLVSSVEDLSQAAGVVPQQFRRRINLGLSMLVEKLRRLELVAMNQLPNSNPNLPLPDYASLIGIQPYLEQLMAVLNGSNSTWMVSLEGFGGIGKTALARAFVGLPETTQRWKKILWVSARQSILSEDGHINNLSGQAATLNDIATRLAEQLGLSHLAGKTITERLEGIQAALDMEEHLVVVDNLETVEEYQQLIPALAKLAGKSRFLITTRQTLRQFPYVYNIPLTELSPQSASDLIFNETQRRGYPTRLDQAAFEQLYQLVGGIPLALKLVSAQLKLRPLSVILTGFQKAQGGMDKLYRYLYWEAWQFLSERARRLMLSFLTSDPEGEDLEFISLMSGMPDENFYTALSELDQFSLLEVSGETLTPRYRLHRLTVTFLQTDILKLWEENDAAGI
ncbi:MAG: hypothetical protein CVU39_00720 [Chloroflexi bacterium HGW-Chloroflexi-10]|nr:MAG: hypothetical protein CVU39_00720 [Chloroflexi bacterium HGW-Chloroflexi-10]